MADSGILCVFQINKKTLRSYNLNEKCLTKLQTASNFENFSFFCFFLLKKEQSSGIEKHFLRKTTMLDEFYGNFEE